MMEDKVGDSRINSANSSENSIYSALFLSAKKASKPPEINDFTIIKPISRGAYGKVFLGCKKNDPKKLYAIKSMRKSDMIKKNMVSHVVTERNALALARSPFCVQLFYSLQTESSIYLVMEYMVGGDLKSLLSNSGFFEESVATFYIAEVVLALEYLHRHGIIHRDIKPDNMLLSARGHVKLTDFGLCDTTLHRDLEISDLVSDTPQAKLEQELMKRTPGQLLSLTSHLSFNVNCMSAVDSHQSNRRDSSTPKGRFHFTKNTCNPLAGPASENSTWDSKGILGMGSTVSDDSVFYPDAPSKSGAIQSVEGSGDTAISLSDSDSFHTCEDIPQDMFTIATKSLSAIETNSSLSDGLQGVKRKRNSTQMALLLSPPETFHDGHEASIRSCHSGLTTDIDCLNLSGSRKRIDVKKSPEHLLFHYHSADNKGGEMDEVGILDASISSLVGAEEHLEGNDTTSHVMMKQLSTPLSTSGTSRTQLLSHQVVNAAKTTRFELPKSPESCSMVDEKLMSPTENVMPWVPSTPQLRSDHPFKTPKSVRRGQKTPSVSDQRILGTPDYLAPELLLRQGHGPAVDWWALGVCLYEFATGIPPFNDDTPEAVFNNILQRKIEWPEGDEALSEEMVDTILSLLTLDPEKRPRADDVKGMHLFDKIPWDTLKDSTPPFIPEPEDETDTVYFQARNNLQHLRVSSCDM